MNGAESRERVARDHSSQKATGLITSKVCEVPTHFLQVSERMMLYVRYEESHRHPLGCHCLGLRLVEFIHSVTFTAFLSSRKLHCPRPAEGTLEALLRILSCTQVRGA